MNRPTIIVLAAFLASCAQVSAVEPAERELTGPATAYARAERLERYQATPTLPPPTTLSAFADACAEMEWYFDLVGLPERFDLIGYRESRCLNRDDVRTSCCHGWLQLWVELHLRDHRLAPRYAACGVDGFDDVNSDTHEDKLRHVCAAKALYDVVGLDAWALTR